MSRELKLNAPFILGSGSRAYLWMMRMLLVLIASAWIGGLPVDTPAQAQTNQIAQRDAGDAEEVKPLSDVLQTVKARVPGQVLDVQLDRSGNPRTYRVRVRSDQGNVVLVVVDAETGRILSTQGNR